MDHIHSPPRSKVSLKTNTKRLSAMIDSLQQDQKDEELLKNRRSPSPQRRSPQVQSPQVQSPQVQSSKIRSSRSSSPDRSLSRGFSPRALSLRGLSPQEMSSHGPSPVSTPRTIQHPRSRIKSNQGSPSKLTRSPAGLNVSLTSPADSNRESLNSSYSGVVQEGVGISYVVKGPHNVIEAGTKPKLPTFPSEETLEVSGSRRPTVGSEEFVVKKVGTVMKGRATSIASLSDCRSGSEGPPKEEALRLLSINSDRGSEHFASENIASEGEISSQPSGISTSTIKPKQKEGWLSPVQSDAASIATSSVPEVTTSNRYRDRGIPPSRSETSDFNPAIPPRSRDRPLSKHFQLGHGAEIREEVVLLDDDELQEESHEHEPNRKLKEIPTESSTTETKSETYFSAVGSAAGFDARSEQANPGSTTGGVNVNEEDEANNVNAYFVRPLPSVPQSAEVHRDSTIKREQGREPEVVTTLTSGSMKFRDGENSEDQYEYIDRSGIRLRSTSTPQARSSSRRTRSSRSKKKKQDELRQFDVDTLSQLLNVTKGTLIGAEFANLGMKIEEKRALERLVDSLSRLTADMVLDPDRYEEGLKRLNKATKALEGF